jgi:transcriptional regulator with XRE-family HTH domain
VAQPGRKRREDSPYAEQSRRLSASLRSLREGAGLSQEELARRADVTLATLRKLEAGQVVNPGHFIVMALLGTLGARPEDLSSHADPADEPLRHVMTRAGRPRARGIRRGITTPQNRGFQRSQGTRKARLPS